MSGRSKHTRDLPDGRKLLASSAATNMITPDHVPRMRLVAYVAETGETRMVNNDGYGNFAMVFGSRPANFRYAVVEIASQKGFTMIDCYDVRTDKNVQTLEPGWTKTFPTLDGALMAGAMLQRKTSIMTETPSYWLACDDSATSARVLYGTRIQAELYSGSAVVPAEIIPLGVEKANKVDVTELVDAGVKMLTLMHQQAETLAKVLRIVGAVAKKTP